MLENDPSSLISSSRTPMHSSRPALQSPRVIPAAPEKVLSEISERENSLPDQETTEKPKLP